MRLPFDWMRQTKTINTYLADALKAFKDNPTLAAFAKELPWASEAATAASQSFNSIGFIVKLYENITFGNEPTVVGLAACTSAFQRAVAETVTAHGPPKISAGLAGAGSIAHKLINKNREPQAADLETFNWSNARNHKFLRQALDQFRETAQALCYEESERNTMCAAITLRFPTYLNLIINHRDLADRFKPFAEFLKQNDDPGTVQRRILQQHAELISRIYYDKPVFGQEAFSLSQIYVPTECRILEWGEISPDRNQEEVIEPQDPFDEKNAGPGDTEATVLELLANPNYRDAIVIQGSAGSGKSTFCWHISSVLLAKGLIPICIRLRDLSFDAHTAITDALDRALLREDDYFNEDLPRIDRPKKLFEDQDLWQETMKLNQQTLSRYVLILDGWDEITVGSEQGFRTRATKLLDEIRSRYLSERPKIGVIVTGRPSLAVGTTGFLHNTTKVLTLRNLKPESTAMLAEQIQSAQQQHARFEVKPEFDWQLKKPRIQPLLESYQKAFEDKGQNDMAVMGSPLLAFLAMRLTATTSIKPLKFIENPTLLYRELVKLTCTKSGQPKERSIDQNKGFRYSGKKLRDLLHATATAMFIENQDNITYQALDFRLGQLLDDWDQGDDLKQCIKTVGKDHRLMHLMISYFFKGGNLELGCEFMHKSFREYLFAEAVVKCLKDFGAGTNAFHPRPEADQHKPFADDDPRQQLAIKLSQYLAPQWLTPEIHRHLFQLLFLEMREALDREKHEPDTWRRHLKLWERIRDGLVDIWAWWVDGVPMRHVPKRNREERRIEYSDPYFAKLGKWCLPHNRYQETCLPLNLSELDGHLGDVLWQLNSVVHFEIACATGWLDLKPGQRWQSMEVRPQKYFQVILRRKWTLFAPGGLENNYFKYDQHWNNTPERLAARINAAGNRPVGAFPTRAYLVGNACPRIWWPGLQATCVNMKLANFFEAMLVGASLNGANLDRIRLVNASLDGACLNGASLELVNLNGASLKGASLESVRLVGANLNDASLERANLERTRLDRARLIEAKFDRACLVYASLDRARLDRARLDRACLNYANLNGAQLIDTSINHAQLDSASLMGTRLDRARLDRTSLTGANLYYAILDDANLQFTDITDAEITQAQLEQAECRNLIGKPSIPTKTNPKTSQQVTSQLSKHPHKK